MHRVEGNITNMSYWHSYWPELLRAKSGWFNVSLAQTPGTSVANKQCFSKSVSLSDASLKKDTVIKHRIICPPDRRDRDTRKWTKCQLQIYWRGLLHICHLQLILLYRKRQFNHFLYTINSLVIYANTATIQNCYSIEMHC